MTHEPSHDAWLREALRHAPDSDVTPPPALRETILRQARATVAPARPTRAPDRWWDWFTKPVVAAAFATVTVSVALTLMWRSGEFDDEAAQIRPQAQAPAAPAPQASEPAQVADTSARAPEAKLEKAAPVERSRRIAQAPAAAPVAAPAEPPPADLRAEARAAAPAPSSRDELSRGQVSPSTAASLAAVDPLPDVASGVALRWTFAGASHPHGNPQQAWFDRLRVATAGQWQRTGNVAREGTPVQLFEGTEQRGTFLLARDHVLWLSPTRGAWRAPLAEADAAQLESLARQW